MPERGRYLLRVLAAVAWSDGELAPEEEAFLRSFARDLDHPVHGDSELEKLLAAPVSRDEFDRYAREFEEKVDSAEARRELLSAVEALVAADHVRRPEEVECLRHLRDWLAEADDAPRLAEPVLWQRLRGAVRASLQTASAPFALVGKLSRKLSQSLDSSVEAGKVSPDRRDFVALFGALVQRVTEADGVVKPEEMASLRDGLAGRFGLNADEIEYVLALIRQRGAEGADRQRLCAEFNRLSTPEQRMDLLRALFAAARADGELTQTEENEARLISNYLWIETQDYVRIRREGGGR